MVIFPRRSRNGRHAQMHNDNGTMSRSGLSNGGECEAPRTSNLSENSSTSMGDELDAMIRQGRMSIILPSPRTAKLMFQQKLPRIPRNSMAAGLLGCKILGRAAVSLT